MSPVLRTGSVSGEGRVMVRRECEISERKDKTRRLGGMEAWSNDFVRARA